MNDTENQRLSRRAMAPDSYEGSLQGRAAIYRSFAPLAAAFAVGLILLIAASSAQAADAPTAVLNPAITTTENSAEVTGTVNIHGGLETIVYVEWSTDQTEWHFHEIQTIPAGSSATVPVSGSTGGFLSPETSYYFRLISENAEWGEVPSPEAPPYPEASTTARAPKKPRVSGNMVTSVSSGEATLNAQITPEYGVTTYRFEYLLESAYATEGWASSRVQSSEPSSLPADGAEHPVSYRVVGIAPGVKYRWRVTGENSADTTTGDESYFAAQALPSTALGSCPNQQFRLGFGAYLPDCRAYEQASPTDKNGMDVQGFGTFLKASSDPTEPGVTFISTSGTGIPAGGGGRQEYTPMLSSEKDGAWSTQRLFPPESQASYALLRGTSANLRFALVEVNVSPAAEPEKRGLDLIDTVTGTVTPVVLGQSEVTGTTTIVFADDAISSDGSYVIFESKAVVAPGASPARVNIYEWKRATGSISLVGVLPPAEGGGAPAEGAESGGIQERYVEAVHTVSTSGDQIYFTDAGTGQLYLRSGLTGTNPTTVRVSEPEPGVSDPNGEKPAFFREATADGSRAFFLSSEKLTANAATGEVDSGTDLYRFDSSNHTLVDITGGLESNENPEGAQVLGVLGISTDGESGYFAAEGDLADGGARGVPNIYRFEEESGEAFHLTFVASLPNDSAGAENWRTGSGGGVTTESPSKSARVSMDGDDLVFASTANLTGYANRGCGQAQSPTAPCTEIYRYSSLSDEVTCISCDPTGEAPIGSAALSSLAINVGDFAVPEGPPDAHLSRSLSSNGDRLFFQTPDSLVARDENGRPSCKYLQSRTGLQLGLPSCTDVYEWEAPGTPGGACAKVEVNGGCLYLLSAGNGSSPSELVDASPDGSSVFITTNSPLVPADRDELTDLYDLRTGGGLATQFLTHQAPCEGEGCRSLTVGAEAVSSPGSSSLVGPGNVRTQGKHCSKVGKNCGKKTKHRRGKRKKQKKHKRRTKRDEGLKANEGHGQAGSGRGGPK